MRMPRSLVLVTVDCLRADHVGFLGYARPTTPFLDALAEDSLVFPTAIVAGAPTYFSFPSILAARYPLALGRDVIGLSPNEPTLATTLRQAGHTTAAFVAGNPYLSRRFGYHAGFEAFHDFLDWNLADDQDPQVHHVPTRVRGRLNKSLSGVCHKFRPLGALYDELYFQYCQRLASPAAADSDLPRRFPPADVVVSRAAQWLAGVTRPFFLWIHLMDPHSPYYPPPQAAAWMDKKIPSPSRIRYLNSYWNRGEIGADQLRRHRDEVVGLYDASIRWVDRQVARLVETLQRSELWDDCILALAADHGEQFLEHGGRYHSPSDVNEEIVHVPLLLHVPEAKPHRLSSQPFSLLHLAPTLLGAVGVSIPDEFQGRNFWPEVSHGAGWDGTAVVESIIQCKNPFHPEDRLGPRILAVRESRYKLVLDFRSRPEQLFDLQTDPNEKNPLPEDFQKPVRRRLLERARDHLSNTPSEGAARTGARVRELGQLCPQSEPPLDAMAELHAAQGASGV